LQQEKKIPSKQPAEAAPQRAFLEDPFQQEQGRRSNLHTFRPEAMKQNDERNNSGKEEKIIGKTPAH
jgi:hypothetical protein